MIQDNIEKNDDPYITQFNSLKEKVEDHDEEFKIFNDTILAHAALINEYHPLTLPFNDTLPLALNDTLPLALNDIILEHVPLPPQCSNYKSLTDPSRRFDFIDSGVKSEPWTAFCDKKNGFTHSRNASDDWVGESWYRIEDGAGTELSEHGFDYSDVNYGTCGSQVGSHMVGGHPNSPGTTSTRSVHFGLDSWSQLNNYNHNIEVTNCNGFFVYKLVGMTFCSLRYCTQ